MDSVNAFESKDGQKVSLQRIYGLCLQDSAMPSNGWLCKFQLLQSPNLCGFGAIWPKIFLFR